MFACRMLLLSSWPLLALLPLLVLLVRVLPSLLMLVVVLFR